MRHLIVPPEMLCGLHAQGVPQKNMTLVAFELIQCSLVQRELMVLVSLRQQGQDLTRASPMVPTRGTRASDETAAGSLTSSRSSVLSKPRRSAVENSFSSSSCGDAGPSSGEGAHNGGALLSGAMQLGPCSCQPCLCECALARRDHCHTLCWLSAQCTLCRRSQFLRKGVQKKDVKLQLRPVELLTAGLIPPTL